MMNFEEALVYELSTITGLDGKVFPQNAQEGTEPPFAIYISSEGERVQTLEGYQDLTELSSEVHVVCKSYEEMKGYTKAVIDRLISFYGRAIGINGPAIKSFAYDEPTEDVEEEFNFNRSVISFRVRF